MRRVYLNKAERRKTIVITIKKLDTNSALLPAAANPSCHTKTHCSKPLPAALCYTELSCALHPLQLPLLNMFGMETAWY